MNDKCEAIAWLANIKEKYIHGGDEEFDECRSESIDMAIKALRQPQIVRCKDCIHRGNAERCVLAAISEEKHYPLFILDNRGEWFCADGNARKVGAIGND